MQVFTWWPAHHRSAFVVNSASQKALFYYQEVPLGRPKPKVGYDTTSTVYSDWIWKRSGLKPTPYFPQKPGPSMDGKAAQLGLFSWEVHLWRYMQRPVWICMMTTLYSLTSVLKLPHSRKSACMYLCASKPQPLRCSKCSVSDRLFYCWLSVRSKKGNI